MEYGQRALGIRHLASFSFRGTLLQSPAFRLLSRRLANGVGRTALNRPCHCYALVEIRHYQFAVLAAQALAVGKSGPLRSFLARLSNRYPDPRVRIVGHDRAIATFPFTRWHRRRQRPRGRRIVVRRAGRIGRNAGRVATLRNPRSAILCSGPSRCEYASQHKGLDQAQNQKLACHVSMRRWWADGRRCRARRSQPNRHWVR